MQIKMKKLAAVTLVELLAVLAIMGTVTALTLPGLKKHSQKTEYAALAQKGYVTLEQALEMASDEQGKEIGEINDSEVGKDGGILLQKYLKKHISYLKDCTSSASNNSECSTNYTPFDGGSIISPEVRSIIGLDGIVIAGRVADDGQYSFIIDVNADAPPNREGVDVFLFNYRKYNSNCVEDAYNGQWKLCPINKAKNLMEDGWKVTYY